MFIQHEIDLKNKKEKVYFSEVLENKLFYTVSEIFNTDFIVIEKKFDECVKDFTHINLIPQKINTLILDLKYIGLYFDYTEFLTEIQKNIEFYIKCGINEYYESHERGRFEYCELYTVKSDDIQKISQNINSYDNEPDSFFNNLFNNVSEKGIQIISKYLSSGSYYPKVFQQLKYIREYLSEMQGSKVLQSPDIFLLFANHHLNIAVGIFLDGLYLYNCTANSPEQEFLEGFIEDLKHTDIQDYGILKARNIIEFICGNIYFILKQGMTIKLCENCGKYFIPYERTDTKYCERESPQNPEMTCKEYGSQRLWYTNSTEYYKLYRKIYSRKQMNARRNPDIVEYNTEFEKYKEQSKQWRKKVKKGIKTEQEFIEWLNKQ